MILLVVLVLRWVVNLKLLVVTKNEEIIIIKTRLQPKRRQQRRLLGLFVPRRMAPCLHGSRRTRRLAVVGLRGPSWACVGLRWAWWWERGIG